MVTRVTRAEKTRWVPVGCQLHIATVSVTHNISRPLLFDPES
jgi:hypothetical protein